MSLLIENISRFVDLDREEEQELLDSFTFRNFSAKEMLLEEGEVCKEHIFVVSGILRHYSIDEELAEHTLSFASSGWWAGDMYSFLSQKPGDSYIEVIEDAEVLMQTRQKQLELFDRIPKLERFYRILIERSLVANQQRLMENLQLPAEERYKRFLERYPDIKYNLPQKDIASYLGITPQFFSKMKGRLLREEY